jgi:hypothetical protein
MGLKDLVCLALPFLGEIVRGSIVSIFLFA